MARPRTNNPSERTLSRRRKADREYAESSLTLHLNEAEREVLEALFHADPAYNPPGSPELACPPYDVPVRLGQALAFCRRRKVTFEEAWRPCGAWALEW